MRGLCRRGATNRRGRWYVAVEATQNGALDPWHGTPYDPAEDSGTGLSRALSYLDNPTLSSDTYDALLTFSGSCLPQPMERWQQSPYRAMRQNALRQLLATSPDFHTC